MTYMLFGKLPHHRRLFIFTRGSGTKRLLATVAGDSTILEGDLTPKKHDPI